MANTFPSALVLHPDFAQTSFFERPTYLYDLRQPHNHLRGFQVYWCICRSNACRNWNFFKPQSNSINIEVEGLK